MRLLRRRHTLADRLPDLSPTDRATTWQLVSLLLGYPDDTLVALLPRLRTYAAALPDGPREPLVVALDQFLATPVEVLRVAYVDTFDVTRKCALHLTYAPYGDTRRRGVALVEFRQAFRRAGSPFDRDDELPDHLSVVLEFGASVDAEIAMRLIQRHRVSVELLRRGLADRESWWLPVLEALRTTLPPLDGEDDEALARLLEAGPPQEDVGYDPAALLRGQDPALLRGDDPALLPATDKPGPVPLPDPALSLGGAR